MHDSQPKKNVVKTFPYYFQQIPLYLMDLPGDVIKSCLPSKCIILLEVGELLINANIIIMLINVEHIVAFRCIPIPYLLLSNLFIQLLILLFKVWNKMVKFTVKPPPITIY